MGETAGIRPRTEGFALIGLGVAARVVGLATTTLAGLAATAIAVRLLGTGPYGVLAFGLSAAAVFGGIGRLGLEPAVARSIALMHDRGADMSRVARGAFTLVGLTGLAGAGVTLAVIEAAPHGQSAATRILLGGLLGVVLYGANTAAVGASLARAAGRVALMEVTLLVPALARLAVLAVLLAVDLDDLRWVAGGYAIGAAVGVLGAMQTSRLVVGRVRAFLPGLAAAREMLTASLPYAVTGLATIVISRFDVVVLGLTGTRVDVGAYEPTLKIVEQGMLLVPLLFVAQYLPVASRVFVAGDRAGFRELYIGLSKLSYVLALPVIALLAAFPEPILHTLYGGRFPARGIVVWMLLPGFVVNLAFGLNSAALAAVGDRRALARTGVVSTVAMTVLALILVPVFGAEGAASATSATYVILNLVVAFELARTAGVGPFRADFALTILSSAAPLAAVLAIRAEVDGVGTWAAVAICAAVWAAWFALLLGTGLVRPAEIRRLLPGKR
jgi:O-antigen/teichoic acid export membrane protein